MDASQDIYEEVEEEQHKLLVEEQMVLTVVMVKLNIDFYK